MIETSASYRTRSSERWYKTLEFYITGWLPISYDGDFVSCWKHGIFGPRKVPTGFARAAEQISCHRVRFDAAV